KTLPLEQYGLEYIYPSVAAAHPFEDGSAAFLYKSVEQTASELKKDEQAYFHLLGPLVKNWPLIIKDVLGPLHFPEHPLLMAKFGLSALRSAAHLSKKFKTTEARGLWAGMAAHSMQPLTNCATSAVGLVLMAAAHTGGWPVAKGGSETIAQALA